MKKLRKIVLVISACDILMTPDQWNIAWTTIIRDFLNINSSNTVPWILGPHSITQSSRVLREQLQLSPPKVALNLWSNGGPIERWPYKIHRANRKIHFFECGTFYLFYRKKCHFAISHIYLYLKINFLQKLGLWAISVSTKVDLVSPSRRTAQSPFHKRPTNTLNHISQKSRAYKYSAMCKLRFWIKTFNHSLTN